MCIAIYVPTGKNIKDEQIRNAFANNGDGAGVMHYDKYGRVNYTKGFMNVESLLAYWHNNRQVPSCYSLPYRNEW